MGPLAYLLGLEGIALLDGWARDHDQQRRTAVAEPGLAEPDRDGPPVHSTYPDLVIAKGNHAPHLALFGLDPEKQWDVLAEKYELLRRLWSEENVTWSGSYRDAITAVTTQPRPFQEPIRVWHGSATSRNSTELAVLPEWSGSCRKDTAEPLSHPG